MHAPVVVALIGLLLHSRPWQVWNTNIVAELQDQVSGVWSPCLSTWEQLGLWKFWKAAQEWSDL
jgi:hypothetical protein